jgi:imidazolonepropionase-like amidohydrolase
MNTALKFTALFASAALAFAAPADDNSFIIRGATIHTMAGRDIKNGSVLVRDGKITGIGENLTAPEGTKVIDAQGMQVYPGFIDSFTDTGLTEIGAVRETSDNSELGKFNPQLSAWMAVNPSSEHIPVTRANGITSSVTVPEGELVGGSASMIHLSGWTTEEMDLNPSVALHITMPVIRTRSFRFPGGLSEKPFEEAKKEHDKQLIELNQFFDDARRYEKAKAAKEPGFEPDLRFDAMIPIINGKVPVMITAMREREIKEAIAFADKQHIKMILAGGAEAWKVIAELKSHNIPVVLRPTLSLPEEEDDPYDKPFTTPGELYKAGILFSFGTYDTQFSRNLPYQAAAAVPFGLSHEAALEGITINAAKIYGMDKQIGSIEEGKIADLVITDGDPLEEQTHVKQLFIAGKEVDLDNKQLRLYEKYKSRP